MFSMFCIFQVLEQEKHTLNRKLDVKTKETKAIQSQHEQDINNLQVNIFIVIKPKKHSLVVKNTKC